MSHISRALSSFPTPSSVLMKLRVAGFSTVRDVTGFTAAELSRECSISEEEAASVIKSAEASRGQRSHGVTALQMLDSPAQNLYIVTFCEALDRMLGGGVCAGRVTEVCGEPGTGKTQLCMQLAVSVQLAECYGGVGGEAVYIDTEGTLVVERLRDLCEAAQQHYADMDPLNHNTGVSVDELMSGIHTLHCAHYSQILALLHALPHFIQQHNKVKLLVIDSIAAPFRHQFEDYYLRNRLLHIVSQSLLRIAHKFNLAVVLTNHMTTRPGAGGWQMLPALGASWSHACSPRLLLHHHGNQRTATLIKSTHSPQTTVAFQITTAGIRDASPSLSNQDEEDIPPTKRLKLQS